MPDVTAQLAFADLMRPSHGYGYDVSGQGLFPPGARLQVDF